MADLVKEYGAYLGNWFIMRGQRALLSYPWSFISRSLQSNLINLQIEGLVKSVCSSLGIDYDEIWEMEPDAGLGNGGLVGSGPLEFNG